MKKALLQQKLRDNLVRCHVCQRRCTINDGQWGYCKTRVNKKGVLYTAIYGLVSSVNVDPIEKKPVFHFQPGSACISFGTYGCNFRCLFCQNWQIAYARFDARRANAASLNLDQQKLLSPKEALQLAEKSSASGMAITYNEPAIWLEYSLDVFKLANDFYTVWVTNGYATPEAIDLIAPYLDVYRVDLKSFSDYFYRKLINAPKAAPVFATTKYVHDNYPQIHIECVTNIIPGWNDNQKMLTTIAQWIKENLGSSTPWHVTRFFPDAQLTNVPPTPLETLYQAREIGLKQGLKFVYIGNMEVKDEDDTFCPKCHNLAIRRTGYMTEVLGVDKEGRCTDCGENLNIKI